MKSFLNLGFSATLKRIFGSGQKTEVASASIPTSKKPVETKVENKVETEASLTLMIWTIERVRYEAARALCTEVDVYPSEAISLCEDISAYVLDTPNGESVVVEARTGSLVGHALEVVRDGIREMTRAQLKNQLDTGRKEFNRMKKHEMTNDAFWKAIKMGSNDLEISQDYQE